MLLEPCGLELGKLVYCLQKIHEQISASENNTMQSYIMNGLQNFRYFRNWKALYVRVEVFICLCVCVFDAVSMAPFLYMSNSYCSWILWKIFTMYRAAAEFITWKTLHLGYVIRYICVYDWVYNGKVFIIQSGSR